jgi:hypothetical protein
MKVSIHAYSSTYKWYVGPALKQRYLSLKACTKSFLANLLFVCIPYYTSSTHENTPVLILSNMACHTKLVHNRDMKQGYHLSFGLKHFTWNISTHCGFLVEIITIHFSILPWW